MFKDYRLRRKITSNTFFNKRYFLNIHPPFNGVRFELWTTSFKKFIQSIDIEFWETLINDMLIPTHRIVRQVVDKLNFLWTVAKKRNFEFDFKTKNFLVMSLNDSKVLYVYNCKSSEEIWDTLKIIYGVSSSVEQEKWTHEARKINVSFINVSLNLEMLKRLLLINI